MHVSWHRSNTAAVAIAVLAALICTAALLYWHRTSAEGARLLMAVPEEIRSHSDLNHFAMSRGRAAFAQYCASCHGSEGQPDPLRGVPDLRDQDWLYGSGRIDEIQKVILYGIRAGNSKGWDLASMPAFATPNPYTRYSTPALTPQDIDDVTEYLYSLQNSSADPIAVARGRKVFYSQSRGLCWDCHGDHAQGDRAIGAPNLTDRIWLYGDGSRRSIRASIAGGRGGSCPAWIGKLSPVTITALAVYTQSLSRPNPAQAQRTPAHD